MAIYNLIASGITRGETVMKTLYLKAKFILKIIKAGGGKPENFSVSSKEKFCERHKHHCNVSSKIQS